MKEKLCSNCKTLKPVNEFYATPSRKNRLVSRCKICLSSYTKERYTYDPCRNMYWGAYRRAKINNLEFNLTIDYIKEIYPKNNKCPYLDIDLLVNNKKRHRGSPSLDRIDNTKGYIKGNVKVISWQANTMKNDASLEELKLFCINILKFLNETTNKITNSNQKEKNIISNNSCSA